MERTITRFWAGREMPEAYQDFGFLWEEMNPGWKVFDFDEETVQFVRDDFPEVYEVIQSLYERDAGRNGIELYVQLADIMGYYLLWKFGGAYFNTDMQPVRPLEPIIPNSAWASLENNVDGRIVNAAIGSPIKNDPFWGNLLEGLPANYWKNPLDEMVMSTGPGYLTEVAHTHKDPLHVFPVETFNPVHWKDIEPGGDAQGRTYPENTIAVHHWGHKKDGRSNHIETATQ